jgi:hypothetical protein
MRCDKSIAPLQAHFAGKNQGTVARIALNLHITWELAAHRVPSTEIGIGLNRSLNRKIWLFTI